MAPKPPGRKSLVNKTSRAVKQGGKRAAQSVVSDSKRNAGSGKSSGESQQPNPGSGVSFEREAQFFRHLGFFLVRHWKATLIAIGVVFLLFLGAAVIQQVVGVGKQVERHVAILLPDSWQAEMGKEYLELTDEEKAQIDEEVANDTDMQEMLQLLYGCLGEGYGKIDSVVAFAAETVDKDTKADYARAWITYVSSDPIARSALIYYHPEAAAPDEGDVYTPEEIEASGQHVYTRDELYYLYSIYESNFSPSQRSASDFVSRISTYANPSRFELQINAVTWALYNKDITPDGSANTLERVVESCQNPNFGK